MRYINAQNWTNSEWIRLYEFITLGLRPRAINLIPPPARDLTTTNTYMIKGREQFGGGSRWHSRGIMMAREWRMCLHSGCERGYIRLNGWDKDVVKEANAEKYHPYYFFKTAYKLPRKVTWVPWADQQSLCCCPNFLFLHQKAWDDFPQLFKLRLQ